MGHARGAHHVHAIDPNGAPERVARAAMQRKLRLAGELERKSRAEVDRLSAIAAEQGWTNAEIAAALGVPPHTIGERRKRGFKRGQAGRRHDLRSKLDRVAPRLEAA